MKTRTYTFNLRIEFFAHEYTNKEKLEDIKDIKSLNFNFSGYIINSNEVYIKPIRTKIISINMAMSTALSGILDIKCKVTVPSLPMFDIDTVTNINDINIEWNNPDLYKDDSLKISNIYGSVSYKNKELSTCNLMHVHPNDSYLFIDTTSDLVHKVELDFAGNFDKKYCKNLNMHYLVDAKEYVAVSSNNIELNEDSTILKCVMHLTYNDICELINGNGKISFTYKGSPVSKDMIPYISRMNLYVINNCINFDEPTCINTFTQNDDFIIRLNYSINNLNIDKK